MSVKAIYIYLSEISHYTLSEYDMIYTFIGILAIKISTKKKKKQI